MTHIFFEENSLARLAKKSERSPEIQVENVIIENPNDIDSWIAKAISAPNGLKEKVFAQALQFAETLTAEYQPDFRRSLLRNIAEEYGNIPESLKDVPASEKAIEPQPLTPEEISEISNGAAWRKRLIDEIDELEAWQGVSAPGGFMASMHDEAEADLPGLIAQYKEKFGEEYPGGDSLFLTVNKMPKDIGAHFDAHGIAKGRVFESLIHLLQNGVDTERPFHTMPLYSDVELAALGASAPYTDGGIIIAGPVNTPEQGPRKLIVDHASGTSDIKYVLLDRQYYFAIPKLEKAFPNVKFIKSSEATKVLKAEVQSAHQSTKTI